ncbi:Protein of unknown function [Micrococcales bacterium KH10]|nr:Protein of unknown function [Micrococcales bacterium KH10]
MESDALRFVFAVAGLIAVLLIALGGPHIAQRRAAQRYPVSVAVLERAEADLVNLPGRLDKADGRSGQTGISQQIATVPPYSRDAFGPAWADMDFNSCDTRNDILARDLDQVTYVDEHVMCAVRSGLLADPYTGEDIEFERGPTSRQVQIDHVVALGDAWQAGAWQWEQTLRMRFANDPVNLLAVSGPANQAKGAATADQWLPPNTGYACRYAVRQVAVKARYRLSVTDAERAALSAALGRCEVD